jgi:hypothetical protein
MFCLINCYFDFYVQYVNVFLRCIVVLVIVDEIDVELGVELAIAFVLELNRSSLSVFDWTFSSWNKLDYKANIFLFSLTLPMMAILTCEKSRPLDLNTHKDTNHD